MRDRGKKKDGPARRELHCFKCGREITPHTLYCPRCNRRQPILMEGLDRAYEDDLEERIKNLEAELEADRKNYFRHFLLGNALFLKGDYQAAVHRYRMALEMKPGFADAKLNLGYVLSLLGEKEAAISMLEEFRRENPHSNRVEGALKLVYELKGLTWEGKKSGAAPVPEIIKPGVGRKQALIKRERVHLPSLIFTLLVVILIVFGLLRRDVISAAYDHIANTAGGFLSGSVSSGAVTADEGDDEGTTEEGAKLGGNDLISRLFGRRQAEEAIEEGEDLGEDPAKGPPVESPDEGDGEEDEEEIILPDPNQPVNAEPDLESYWPMEVGYEWEYDGFELNNRGGLVEGSEKTGTIKVVSILRGDDTPVYEVNNLGNTSYFYETTGGIYQARDPDHVWSSSVPNLEKPVNIGDKWNDTHLGMGYEVVEEVDMRVPAGLFKTVRIKTWLVDYPEQITEIFFGQGIGPVKLLTGSAKRGFRIWELSSYPRALR